LSGSFLNIKQHRTHLTIRRQYREVKN